MRGRSGRRRTQGRDAEGDAEEREHGADDERPNTGGAALELSKDVRRVGVRLRRDRWTLQHRGRKDLGEALRSSVFTVLMS